jgi:protein-tyrosine-phosphatase
MTQTLILIIGAADTGRAPMTAALLRRMLVQEGHDWAVESAGVVGHDDDPAEPEARNAMVALGLDISFHRARSLTAELVTAASLLLAVDRGTARVLYARYPTLPIPITSLGEIAGTSRDIPDPFRMQVGAWISYAREIEAMLRRGLGRVVELVGAQNQGTTERRESHGTESAEDTEPHSIPTQHAASPMEGKDTPSPLPQGEELGVREPSPGAGAGGEERGSCPLHPFAWAHRRLSRGDRVAECAAAVACRSLTYCGKPVEQQRYGATLRYHACGSGRCLTDSAPYCTGADPIEGPWSTARGSWSC